MELQFFWRGLVLGFSIAAPVGPIGVLCLRRTLTGGRWYGLVSGLGAATADATYGLVAGLGLTLVAQTLLAEAGWLRPAGALFLCFLGLRTLVSQAVEHPQVQPALSGSGLAGAYFSTLALTLTNPLTILSFTAVFAGLGLGGPAHSYGAAAALVGGIFLGSAAWWVLLTSAADRMRARLSVPALTWVNRLAGVVILGFGAAAVWAG